VRITVDRELCQSHGQCSIAAPEIFRLDDDGTLHYDPSPPQTLVSVAEDAMDVCPTQAIEVEP
jgi:ferredoxin